MLSSYTCSVGRWCSCFTRELTPATRRVLHPQLDLVAVSQASTDVDDWSKVEANAPPASAAEPPSSQYQVSLESLAQPESVASVS